MATLLALAASAAVGRPRLVAVVRSHDEGWVLDVWSQRHGRLPRPLRCIATGPLADPTPP
jgi:hypothetical protein